MHTEFQWVKPKGKRPLGRPRCRWEDNMKMDFMELLCDPRDWIDLAGDREPQVSLKSN